MHRTYPVLTPIFPHIRPSKLHKQLYKIFWPRGKHPNSQRKSRYACARTSCRLVHAVSCAIDFPPLDTFSVNFVLWCAMCLQVYLLQTCGACAQQLLYLRSSLCMIYPGICMYADLTFIFAHKHAWYNRICVQTIEQCMSRSDVIYIYICAHIHTHIHTYIHMHIHVGELAHTHVQQAMYTNERTQSSICVCIILTRHCTHKHVYKPFQMINCLRVTHTSTAGLERLSCRLCIPMYFHVYYHKYGRRWEVLQSSFDAHVFSCILT
jgi:hypothetical protein